MDCLHLVCPRSINPVKADRQKTAKGRVLAGACSANSLTNRSFLDPTVQCQSQKKALLNKTKWNNELLQNIGHKSLTCRESSCLISDSSNVVKSSKMLIQSCEVDNVVKRSSRKKNKKKGKRGKKHPCNSGSTVPEILPEECPKVSSVPESFHNIDVDHKDAIGLASTAAETSLPEGRGNSSETHKTGTSYNDVVDILEEATPKFSGTSSGGNSENQTESEDSALSVCVGVKDTHNRKVYFNNALHHRGCTDKSNSFLLDQISTYSNSKNGAKFCNGQKQSAKESFRTDISKSQASDFRKGSSSYESLLNNIIDASNHTKKTTYGSQGWNGSQKVQRNCTRGRFDDLKKVPVFSQFDGTLEEASLLKKNCTGIENEKQLKDTRSWKSRSSAGLKQECKFSSIKGSHADMANSDGCAKFTMSRKEMLDISSKNNGAKHMPPESVSIVHVGPNAIDGLESISKANSSMKSETVEALNLSLPKSCIVDDQPKLVQVQCPVFLPHFSGNSVGQGQKKVLAEDCFQNSRFVSVVLKWVPIGTKDGGLTNSADSSSSEHSDGPAAEIWTPENSINYNGDCIPQNLVPKADVMYLTQSSGDKSHSSPDDKCTTPDLKNQEASMLKEQKNKESAGHCLNRESGVWNAFKSVPDKIAEAVKDACRGQLDLKLLNGPPVIQLLSLKNFSNMQVQLFTIHQPVILAQGTSFVADDYEDSKRSGANRFYFSAYFVPCLSAVQLFKNQGSCSADTSYQNSSSEVLDSSRFIETSERSSSMDHLAMISVLFPQLQKELESYSREEFISKPSSASPTSPTKDPQRRRSLYDKIKESIRGDGPLQYQGYGDPTILDSVKLKDLHPRSWYSVAWYPIYRIPEGSFRASFFIFHSLGHLVRQSARFDSQSVQTHIVSPVVGLQFLCLALLLSEFKYFESHPISIMLPSNMPVTILLSLAGLQFVLLLSESECWFRLHPSLQNQKKEVLDQNPGEILKGRLRTLEETASLMASAEVKIGTQTSVNRHPDYEFFCSRKRW
ncbi:hypothetical protein TorRG33x02_305010 [Trema orientale]|uniref:Uncharacterized protein n=1 Tax=Trema orientale TaxID=63057 RepID=A0A2P5BY08_TREOI|nr:hypothetical protein TorRG33x02_305010 [Trema orientale]